MYLGRFELGQFTPLHFVAMDDNRTAAWPATVPIFDVYDGNGAHVLTGEMPPLDMPGQIGAFWRELRMSNTFGLGLYVATMTYELAGVPYVAVNRWEVIAGGDPEGGFVSMHHYRRPHADFIVAKLDSVHRFIGTEPAVMAGSPQLAPTLTTAVVDVTGTELTLTFDQIVTGHADFSVAPSAGAASLTYVSGDGTMSKIFTIDRTILQPEAVPLYYVPGDVVGGNGLPLAAISAYPVTNYSTVVPSIPAPTVTSVVVDATGNFVTVNLSQAVTGASGFTFYSGAETRDISFHNGEGTAALVFSVHDRTILTSDALTVDYAPGDVMGTSQPLQAFTGMAVTNGSTVPSFLPSHLANLRVWLDATTGTFQTSGGAAAVADNAPIGEWLDQSGSGETNDVLQAIAGKRPVLKLAVQNGLPVVRFDGVDDFLQSDGFGIGQPCTYFVVLKCRTAVVNAAYWSDVESNLKAIQSPAGGDLLLSSMGLGPTVTLGTSAFHVVRAVYDEAASELSLDGAAAVTGNVGTADGSGVTLGARIFGTTPLDFAATDIAEFIAYDYAMTDVGNINRVVNYLMTKWAITATPATLGRWIGAVQPGGLWIGAIQK